ncbi:MAG TPA: peptide-methionine (R)-S-oxide reductase MsrB [Candidatus Rubrimentiphilum sp.]|nr:peptide-methionine (R)-S-oxide reductase MsrB [Candidatus Rubrimentiphilum sp.]
MSHRILTRGAFAASLASAIGAFALMRGARASDGYAVTHSDAEWRQILGPARYEILRQGGTEPPGSSALNNEHRSGIYHCAGCDLSLFSSKTKYDAGEGWPSFYTVLPNATRTKADYELLEPRTEVHCKRCGGHLGHIFNDGPQPTGLRYCIDGLALKFAPGRAA